MTVFAGATRLTPGFRHGRRTRPLIHAVLQEVLEAEMNEALRAEKSEPAERPLGYRSGYYVRSLITRVGKIELGVPQDREGTFRPNVLNVTNVAKRPWWELWQRCTSKTSAGVRIFPPTPTRPHALASA